jgi:putative transposase
MKRIPRPVLRALEALAQSPINTSALAMAEGQDFAHDTLYRALNQPLALFFELSLELCKAMGGLDRGYLILDDVLIQRYRSGKLGLKKARDTSTGAWVFGLSLVVLAWTDGKRRIPLAFLPYFGEEESKLDLALALLEWAKEAGFRPEGVLFDAWYAARQVLEWLHAHGWPFVTRLRSNRVLDGVQLGRHGGTRWVKAGRLRGLTFAVGVLKRGGKFYGTDRESWWGVGMREIYRLRQAIEEIFRGLQQELGWTGHRHWRRARLLAHLALGLVAYGLIERQREGLGLSFYQCRRRLIAGKLKPGFEPSVTGASGGRVSPVRKGVRFHNGAPFTAEDVLFKFQRARGPQVRPYQHPVLPGHRRRGGQGPYTVVFRLRQPNQDFLFNLARPDSVIGPKGGWRSRNGSHRHRPLPLRGLEPGRGGEAGAL